MSQSPSPAATSMTGGSPVSEVPPASVFQQPSVAQYWTPRGVTSGTFAPVSVSALQFDANEELLWLGDAFGTVSSFAPQQPFSEIVGWHLYSSLKAFRDPVVSISCSPDLIYLASPTALRVQKRGGATVLKATIPNTQQRKVLSMEAIPESKSIVVAGDSPGLQQIFLDDPNETATIATDGVSISALRRTGPNMLLTGSAMGTVCVRDIDTFSANLTLEAPFKSNRVTSVDMLDNIIAAAAIEQRHSAAVKLFDARMVGSKDPLASFQIPGFANCHVRLHRMAEEGTMGITAMTSHGAHSGAITDSQLLPVTPQRMYGDNSHSRLVTTSLAVGRSGSVLVVGSDKGTLTAYSKASETFEFKNTSQCQQPKQPTTVSQPRWGEKNDHVDYGFDHTYDFETDGPLCSDWPPPNYMILSAPAKPLSVKQHLAEVQRQPIHANHAGIQRCDLYAKNPKDKLCKFIPNPYPHNISLGEDPTKAAAALALLKKESKATSSKSRSGPALHKKLDEALQVCYSGASNVQYDWKTVNTSHDLVGLDNSLFESWVNPLLQCLFYAQAPVFGIRRTFMKHCCKKRYCVACELGFLYTNMSIQSAYNMNQPIMQPSNLLRTLRRIEIFNTSGVFDTPSSREDAVAKCHEFMKIFLEQLDLDLHTTKEDRIIPKEVEPNIESYMVTNFGTELQLQLSKTSVPPRFFWEVPAEASKVDEGLQHLLKQLETHNKGEQISIKRLPKVLVLLLNPEHGNLRPPPSLKFSRTGEEYNYQLASNVVHVADDAEDPGNFVAHIKLAESWFVFNDYCVSLPARSEEALESYIPHAVTHAQVVTFYVLDDVRNMGKPLKSAVDDRPILWDYCSHCLTEDLGRADIAAMRAPDAMPVAPPIVPDQSFNPNDCNLNDIVAIDAEYVRGVFGNRASPDEPEWYRRQRNKHHLPVRVSCILSRENGHEQTIIDDYIATPEEIEDYVTQYSGIFPGDLDEKRSPYCLTTLKGSYLKLRCLMDRGVRFLGHGLDQDFRVINLAIPRNRIIDTLELFRKKGSRKLSLRFLAHYVLQERVQEDMHDSIEDARTALRLYRRYQELTASDSFDKMMDHLLTIGADVGWTIPGEGSSATPTAQTPSVTPSLMRTGFTPSPAPAVTSPPPGAISSSSSSALAPPVAEQQSGEHRADDERRASEGKSATTSPPPPPEPTVSFDESA